MNNDANEIVANGTMNNSKRKTSKSFEYKTKITGRIFDNNNNNNNNNNNKLDTEVVVPLKHLRNFGDLLICL